MVIQGDSQSITISGMPQPGDTIRFDLRERIPYRNNRFREMLWRAWDNVMQIFRPSPIIWICQEGQQKVDIARGIAREINRRHIGFVATPIGETVDITRVKS